MKTTANSNFADPLQQVGRTFVLWRGRKWIYFGGCDYFRLSSDRRILGAVRTGLQRYGLNVAASRKTTGNHLIYGAVEKSAASFFGSERAALVSSGYLTNIVAAHALRGTVSHALMDERAHSSLRDAADFLQCPVTEFKHRDYQDAFRQFQALKSKEKVALLTDGLFAHDGSLAPVREYRQALGGDVLLWIDDAHAGGVLGRRGRGSLEQAGLVRHNVVQTITFSKAFGVYGGAVLCDSFLYQRLIEQSHAVTGNTPLPPPLAAGILEALRLLKSERSFRETLRRNVEAFWKELGAGAPATPIVSLRPAEPEGVRRALMMADIFPSFIRYPGGPVDGYFRFAISSAHSLAQIKKLARVLASVDIVV